MKSKVLVTLPKLSPSTPFSTPFSRMATKRKSRKGNNPPEGCIKLLRKELDGGDLLEVTRQIKNRLIEVVPENYFLDERGEIDGALYTFSNDPRHRINFFKAFSVAFYPHSSFIAGSVFPDTYFTNLYLLGDSEGKVAHLPGFVDEASPMASAWEGWSYEDINDNNIREIKRLDDLGETIRVKVNVTKPYLGPGNKTPVTHLIIRNNFVKIFSSDHRFDNDPRHTNAGHLLHFLSSVFGKNYVVGIDTSFHVFEDEFLTLPPGPTKEQYETLLAFHSFLNHFVNPVRWWDFHRTPLTSKRVNQIALWTIDTFNDFKLNENYYFGSLFRNGV